MHSYTLTPSLISVTWAKVIGTVVAQVLHGGADLLQRYPGVEQPLDDLEHQDVAEAVQPLRPEPWAARTLGSTSPVRAQ